MIRLIRVELTRLLSRRIPLLAVLAAVAMSLFAIYFVNNAATQLDRARSGQDEMLEQAIADWEQNGERYIAECVQGQEEERRAMGDASIDWGCDEMTAPTAEEYYGSMPSLEEQYEQLLVGLNVPLLLLVMALGSTHVAAEFSHRTMGSWLTFVPRRLQVYASKIVSAAIAAIPVVAVGLVVVLIGVPLVFRLHGIDDSVPPDGWSSIIWTAVRTILLGAAAGAFGAALGFLLKHSAAVIGLMLAYAVAVEGFVATSLPDLSRYTLMRNGAAVVDHGTRWTTYVCNDTGTCREVRHTLSFTHGVVTLSIILAVVLALALWRFWRSDVD